MDLFRVESIRIKATPEKAFRYVADARHLPRWTRAFKAVVDSKAIMETPAGKLEVDLEVKASPTKGTVDWLMKFPDGSDAAAYSRFVPDSNGGCIYSFVLMAPPVPLEQLEGTLNQQSEILKQELEKLSAILGGG